jgi:hypothetical protein
MKRFSAFLTILFSFAAFAFAQPVITGVLVPQVVNDNTAGTGEGPRTPYIVRAKITGLTASATYRYMTRVVNLVTDGATSTGAGNQIQVRQSGNFGYTTAASLATAGGYDSIVASTSGEYEGWFGIEPTGNARFTAGNNIHIRIVLNNGTTGNTTNTHYLTITDSSRVTGYGTGATQSTGIWSRSLASEKNIAVLWDNVLGVGRPLSCAIVESDGIAYRSASNPNNYPLFYRNGVDSFSGAWGTLIPNNNANGVLRIENRKLTDGSLVYANFDADGIWPTGLVSTVSPAGGYTAIHLDSSDVPLIPVPTFYFDKTAYTIAEGGGSVVIGVKYKNPNLVNTSVDVAFKAGGSATLGTDFTFAASATLTFAPTDTFKTVSIPITNDGSVESSETFSLRLTNATLGGLLRADSVTTVTINDDDNTLVFFTASKQSVTEIGGSVTVTVKLGTPATVAGSVDISANAASATTADYTFTNTTLNFAVGDSVKTNTITINDDFLVEGNEYFIMQLSNTTNLSLGTSSDTVTITDNDYPRYPIGQISTVNATTGISDSLGKKYDEVGIVYGINYRPAGLSFIVRDNTGGITAFRTTGNLGYTVTEGDSIRFIGTIAQFNGLTEMLVDSIALLGTGKTLKNPTVVTKIVEANENDLIRINNVSFNTPIATWPTGAANISIHNATDTIILRLQLANVDILGGAAPRGTFDIIGLGAQFDNSNPYFSGYQIYPRSASDIIIHPSTITIDTLPVSVKENVGTVKVKMTINNVNGLAASVLITNAGTATTPNDYVVTNSISFPANAVNGDSVILSYSISDDAIAESTETIVSTYTALSSTALVVGGSKTITIQDDDAPATLTIDTATLDVNEGVGTVSVKVKISNVNGKSTTATLAFTGTATSGTDYNPSATLVNFPAAAVNGDSVMVSYSIIDDATYEAGTETIITTYTAGNNCSFGTGSVQLVKITDNDPNGINAKYTNNGVSVYPNPSNGSFTVKSEALIQNVKLMDMLGQEVIVLQPNAQMVKLNNLASGMYLLITETKSGLSTQRIVVE